MKTRLAAMIIATLTSSAAFSQVTPLALSAAVEMLGRGADGTVVGAVLQIAPEDRSRAGDRVRVVTTLLVDGDVVDRQSGVVSIELDGTALIYREWDPGTYELQIAISSITGNVGGASTTIERNASSTAT